MKDFDEFCDYSHCLVVNFCQLNIIIARASTGNAFDDLDSIVVDGEDDMEFTSNPLLEQGGKGGGGGGMFGGFFGGGKKVVQMVARSMTVAPKPDMIEGWLQKKGASGKGGIMGADWTKR